MQLSDRALTGREERNRAIVLDYYDLLCRQWNFDAARRYIGSSFVQHNPTIADGIRGLQDWVATRPPFADQLQADVRRVLVDGNYVVLHTVVSAPTMPEIPAMAIADFFRLEDHRVVEHWDVIQPVPPKALHENGMA